MTSTTSAKILATDLSARFGTSKVAVPDLLGDWRHATVQAAIEGAARARFQPELDAALDAAEARKGAPLDRKEEWTVCEPIEQKRMPQEIPHVAPAILKDQASKDRAVSRALSEGKARAAGLKDPFTAIARNVPGSRAKETLFYENDRLMVLLDTFAKHPKALVVPKQVVSFPSEVPKALMDEIARVASAVATAFSNATGCPRAQMWINPPQDITVRQLHVHVSPDLPKAPATSAVIKRIQLMLASQSG